MKIKENHNQSMINIFLKNFIGGAGWAVGVTLGFAILVSLLSFMINQLGGVPVIGRFFGSIVSEAMNQLQTGVYQP